MGRRSEFALQVDLRRAPFNLLLVPQKMSSEGATVQYSAPGECGALHCIGYCNTVCNFMHPVLHYTNLARSPQQNRAEAAPAAAAAAGGTNFR